MNKDFPRIISLIRKERKLSQKQAAADLGIAQALLSHYEKGKRECGLDFLIKIADYYNVSTDYLLGRSAVSDGTVILTEDIPEAKNNMKNTSEQGPISVILSKKLITGSIEIIYSLLAKSKNSKLTQSVSNMLSLTVYRSFRILYRLNSNNDKNLFGISEELAFRSASSVTAMSEGKALLAASENQTDDPVITTAYLENEYQKQGAALLNLIKNTEAIMKPWINMN